MTDTRNPTDTADFTSIAWDAYRYARAIRIDQRYAANLRAAGKPTTLYDHRATAYAAAIAALPLPAGATAGFWDQPTYQSGEALTDLVADLLYFGYGNPDSPEYLGSTPLPVAEVDAVAALIVANGQWNVNERYALAVFEAQANGDAGNPAVAREATFMADYGVPWGTAPAA